MFILLSIYRPPSYNINDVLNFFDQKVNTLNDRKCLIIGDINIDLLISNKTSETLNNIFITNNFYLCNEAYPTRYSAQRESLLDHIALNFEYNEINLNIIENCLSDHAIQILNLGNNNNQDTKTSVYRNLNKIDYKLLSNKLNVIINKCNENNDNFNTTELYNSIIDAYNSSIYTKKMKIRSYSNPCFNEKTFNLIKQRDFYYHRKKKVSEQYLHTKCLQ